MKRDVVATYQRKASAQALLDLEIRERPQLRPRIEKWDAGWVVVRLGAKP